MNNKNELKEIVKKTFQNFKFNDSTKVVGEVISVYDGIAVAIGLNKIKYEEMVIFSKSQLKGIVLSIEENKVLITILGDYNLIMAGEEVVGQNEYFSINLGENILGRVLNGYGEFIDELGSIDSVPFYVDRDPIEMLKRAPLKEQLLTGIKSIDWLIPVAFGQRQLILGNRGTGKTAIAIDTMINLANAPNVICIYVSIGQRINNVPNILEALNKNNVKNFVIVSALASDPTSMRFLSPMVGCAIGEYFRDMGKNAVIFYDNLSCHAVAYREMSLILKRPPGREAYPGDIFYIHARLLERSCKVSSQLGGGSLTAFPIIETIENDVSGYIPTNVISITDGQIFLGSDEFNKNIKPAINIGISVSRVGGDAYYPVIKKFANKFKLKLAKYEEALSLVKLSSYVTDDVQKILDEGNVLRYLLCQPAYKPLNLWRQIILLYAFSEKYITNKKHVSLFNEKIDTYFGDANQIIAYNENVLKRICEEIAHQ
jgi:F-type H+-transporting ATPase subunit alpha